MPSLTLWNDYTRQDVHAIFSPNTKFTPQAGTWGLQGMVRVPARQGDWVFFVTFGREQGDHVFDESITEDGVLSWQSQPAQRLTDDVIRELIGHDERVNNIYLFLRTKNRAPYCYLGTIGYLKHDSSRERPVHFQWQLLQWPVPQETMDRIGLSPTTVSTPPVVVERGARPPAGISFSAPPSPKISRQGVSSDDFRHRKSPDYSAQDARNRMLGLQGELLVLEHEKNALIAADRTDLAELVTHVSVTEGDGAGYDIHSFFPDGRDRYIEVKTTQGDARTAFYISPNELAFSIKNPNTYALYRLYQFDKNTQTAQAYVLEGDLTAQLALRPLAYKAELQVVPDK